MSELLIPPEQKDKFNSWEKLREERPNLIIEVGSSAVGAGTGVTGKKLFTEGKYTTYRYLCIDPSAEVRANNVRNYSFGLQTRIEDPTVAEYFASQADEIWLKNTASIISKRDWYTALHTILKEDGTVLIFDSYTVRLHSKEKNELKAFFDSVGFEYEDLTDIIEQREERHHLLVTEGNRLKMGTDRPLILKLKKKPQQA